MTDARVAFVHEAELQLDAGTDPAAIGAAVTTVLCGHWEHEGPCRWPHNNDLVQAGDVVNFRTLFVATAVDEAGIRKRIEQVLVEGKGWSVLRVGSRPLVPPEEPLARRLAATPPASPSNGSA